MAAKQAFDQVFAGTTSTLKTSASKQKLRAFVNEWGELDAALPQALKGDIRTLPITDNALVLSGVPTEDANLFTIGRGYNPYKKLSFPICSMAAFACNKRTKSNYPVAANHLGGTYDFEWHFDQGGEPYLLSLLGINKGPKPAATALLSLGTALENPDFYQLVSRHEKLGPIIKQGPKHFGKILSQGKLDEVLRLEMQSINPAINPTGAVVLEKGDALFFFNPNLMHGRLNPEVTKEMFPDAKGTEGNRRLMRHFLPLNPAENPLLNALNAAKERLGISH